MSIETLFAFVFVLAAVVVLHELGHFLVAKAVGVYCKTFSVGLGPKLLKKRIGETEYALSAFPLGGYVKMAGEGAMEAVQDAGTGEAAGDYDADGRPIPPERWFSSKTPLQRMAVVVAGPLMNLVLALVVTIGVVAVQGVTVQPVTTVGEVAADSPAADAGLQVGDRIVAVAGEPVDSWGAVVNGLIEAYERAHQPVDVEVERGGRHLHLAFTPRQDENGRWELGLRYLQDTRVGNVKKGGPAWKAGLRRGDVIVSIDGKPVHRYGEIAEIVNESIDKPLQVVWKRGEEIIEATIVPEPAEVAVSYSEVKTIGRIYYEEYTEQRKVDLGTAIQLGSRATWGMVQQTAGFLKVLVTGGASKDAVSGPLRIAQFSGEMVRWGFDRLLLFLALFSVNLFLLNLLPVPVLDGGHAVFILYEMITRRRPDERVQAMATQVGFVALLLLMAWVLTMDVLHVVG